MLTGFAYTSSLGYERVYQPLYKEADTPVHIHAVNLSLFPSVTYIYHIISLTTDMQCFECLSPLTLKTLIFFSYKPIDQRVSFNLKLLCIWYEKTVSAMKKTVFAIKKTVFALKKTVSAIKKEKLL